MKFSMTVKMHRVLIPSVDKSSFSFLFVFLFPCLDAKLADSNLMSKE